MYSFLSETDDSTTVNFSAYGKFLPGKGSGNQLLTIGSKFLRIFRTNPYALVPPANSGDDWEQKTKLECVFKTKLFSPVKSLATSKFPSLDAEAILLAFDDAKLSIVTIDEKERKLNTLSMHSFEDEYLREGNTKNFPNPMIKSDPGGRCAAMLVYGKHLAILPFIEGQKHTKSFIISLKQIDSRLENVADIVFLDGYYEPTLLFLFEPLQTTAGRASIRFDTMCIMGVSVNVNDQRFAVVWQLNNLPMDGSRLLAIPKPIGGAVVFGSNTAIYLNQAVPPSGIMLNSCYDNYTKFPLKNIKDMAMTLDASCHVWLKNGNIGIGTMEGQFFVLSLVTDNANTVKGLNLKYFYDISIPFTLTMCAPGHLFVGSRLGDSQLLKYSIATKEVETNEHEEVAQKKQKHSNVELDEEELALYGVAEEDMNEKSFLVMEEFWEFEELDRLTNIGPIRSITAGQTNSSPFLDIEDRACPLFDMISASGYAKNGCICILQRTIRPEIISSSGLDGAEQLWAVGQREDGSHKYLMVSRARSTLTLELSDEMVEIEDPLFLSSEPTLLAGELADGAVVVQITAMGVVLVAGNKQIQQFELDTNFPITSASIIDPYVAMLTQNGKLFLYQLVFQPSVHLQEVELFDTVFGSSTVTALSIYKDMSGMMVRSTASAGENSKIYKDNRGAPQESALEDAEDFLLYGEPSATQSAQIPDNSSRKRKWGGIVSDVTGGEESDAVDPNSVEPTFWLVAAVDNGKFVICSLSDLTVVFQVRKFTGMPPTLFDITEEEEEKDRKEFAHELERKGKDNENEVNEGLHEVVRRDERVVELEIIGMGISQCRPVLLAVVDDMVIAYEMYQLPNKKNGHLCIAFKRLPLSICLRSSPYMGSDGRRQGVEIGQDGYSTNKIITSFERVSSIMHGAVICGQYPTLVFFGAWGGLRSHPIIVDGPIRSFTAFNNSNVSNGFLYLSENSQELRIAELPTDINYDLPFPCKKVNVGATVHFNQYMMESQVYAVVTSTPRPSNKIWVVINDDKQEEVHEKPNDFVLPTIPHFVLNLYSPVDWAPVPNTSIEFEVMEHVTACEEVALKSESTISGLKTYLAVGTIHNFGEEHLVRGRIILAEVIDVVPIPGQPTSKHKIKITYNTEQKGPVTSICSVNGFLLTGMGQKIFIWGLRDNEIQGVSFLDMHYYVHSLKSFRNLALACDMQESMSLVRFQEQFKALSVAARDDRIAVQPPMQAQYIVDNNHLGFLLSDESGNICMFNYMPELNESVGGERLVLRSVVNVGTNINAWIRVKGNPYSVSASQEERKALSQQQTSVWASLDGSIGYVRPISEKTFRRLSTLHQFMTVGIRHDAGLNPKGARAAKPVRAIINNANQKNMVDGDLVNQFLHLSTAEKQEISRKFGASRYHIIDDLVQIQRLSTFF
ncbi:unnamed protein product [Auanema sp. JU1783]|nr:unnamed protein product [Auanema sp. JU1783]